MLTHGLFVAATIIPAGLGSHIGALAVAALTGATGLSIVAHAVNTFPVPENRYAKWFLGTIQYAVGQRQQARETKAADSTGEAK